MRKLMYGLVATALLAISCQAGAAIIGDKD